MIELVAIVPSFALGYFAHRRVNVHYRKRWRHACRLLQEERGISGELDQTHGWKIETWDNGASTVYILGVRGKKKLELNRIGRQRHRSAQPDLSFEQALKKAIDEAQETIKHLDDNDIRIS